MDGEITLGKITRYDHKMHDWLNDPEVNKYLDKQEWSVSSIKAYIEEKAKKPGVHYFYIWYKEEGCKGVAIGTAKLEYGEIGIMIGDKEYWGRGIGTEVVRRMKVFALDVIGLREVRAGIMAGNEGSFKCFRRAGFEWEMLIRNGEK